MGYLKNTIVTLGSHSALQILKGAKDEGFKTAIVCTPSRIPLYKSFSNFIDEILEVITGQPQANASSIGKPNPSNKDG